MAHAGASLGKAAPSLYDSFSGIIACDVAVWTESRRGTIPVVLYLECVFYCGLHFCISSMIYDIIL